MNRRSERSAALAALLLITAAGLLSLVLVGLRESALAFHTRDYAYYTEFIIRNAEPGMRKAYSLNPGGYNFLGAFAIDGTDSLYQWVHVEPVRFVHSWLYGITGTLWAVHIFNVVLLLLPAWISWKWLNVKPGRRWSSILMLLCFVAFPSFAGTAGYDNRPSLLLGTFYFTQLYAWLGTSNDRLRIFSFFLMFFIREEALIFNFFVLLVAASKASDGEFSWRKWSAMAGGWAVYLLLLLVYFGFWKYKLNSPGVLARTGILFAGVATGGIFWLVLWKRRKIFLSPVLLLLLPAPVIIAQYCLMSQQNAFPQEGYTWWNDPRNTLWWMIAWAGACYFCGRYGTGLGRTFPFAVLCLVFITMQLTAYHGIRQQMERYNESRNYTSLVWDAKKKIASGAFVLTDYSTHQAFTDRNENYCIERLPSFMKLEDRFYPGNREAVKQIFPQADYMVISVPVYESLRADGLFTGERQWKEVQRNPRYIILE